MTFFPTWHHVQTTAINWMMRLQAWFKNLISLKVRAWASASTKRSFISNFARIIALQPQKCKPNFTIKAGNFNKNDLCINFRRQISILFLLPYCAEEAIIIKYLQLFSDWNEQQPFIYTKISIAQWYSLYNFHKFSRLSENVKKNEQ